MFTSALPQSDYERGLVTVLLTVYQLDFVQFKEGSPLCTNAA